MPQHIQHFVLFISILSLPEWDAIKDAILLIDAQEDLIGIWTFLSLDFQTWLWMEAIQDDCINNIL